MKRTTYAAEAVPRSPVPKRNIKLTAKSVYTFIPVARVTMTAGASCASKEKRLTKSSETKFIEAPLSSKAVAYKTSSYYEPDKQTSNYNIASDSSDVSFAYVMRG